MDVSYHIDYMYVRIFWHVYLVTFEQLRVTCPVTMWCFSSGAWHFRWIRIFQASSAFIAPKKRMGKNSEKNPPKNLHGLDLWGLSSLGDGDGRELIKRKSKFRGFGLWSLAMIIISMHDWLATRPLFVRNIDWLFQKKAYYERRRLVIIQKWLPTRSLT